MTGSFFSVLAAAGMVTAGVAATATVRSADALPSVALAAGAPAASKCSVRVVRTGTPGAADIVREQLADGGCVCVVSTGPASANGPAEDAVKGLLRDRECSNAPAPGEGAANAVNAATAASFAPVGGLLPVVLGASGAGGLAATLGNASNG